MTTTEKLDISRFVSKEVGARHVYTKEHVVRGWRYATDGRIAVRVPGDGEPDTTDNCPAFDSVFTKLDREQCVNPWSSGRTEIGVGKCLVCGATGYLGSKKCDECDGSGEADCPHCGSEMTCKECDGKGHVCGDERCPTCKGEGKLNRVLHRIVGPVKVRADHDTLVSSLPNVRFQMPTADDGTVLFIFDGGDGAVVVDRNPERTDR